MKIHGEYHHPTFLYESLLNLVGLTIMLVLRRKCKKLESGDLVGIYLTWYGMVRIFTETLRSKSGANEILMLGPIPVSIALSVIFIICGIAFLVAKRFIGPRNKYLDILKEVEENRFEIYLKMNSKLVSDVYETIKSIFLVNYDNEFYEHRPERRDNLLMNNAVENILKHFEETIKESEYNTKIQENYRTVNETNTTFRNEIYQNVKQIAHEIKNQLSILDIYTRIFEKKTGDLEVCEPLKKSISLIKAQIEQFKNIDVVNLQEKNIKTIIQDSIKIYSGLLKEKNNKLILIDEMAAMEANCFVDEEKFSIVINNVIKNAHDSTQNDEIIVKLSQVDEKVKISIINHGEMIEQNKQDKIFEQGFTTKKDGWGIGLSVCKKFIGSQFGTFELAKSDENETIFTLTLPLAQTR
jgi:signal transduction histidine kinase/uncharacterized membrane protein